MLSLDAQYLPSTGQDASSRPAVVLVHGFAVTARQCWVQTGWERRLGRSRDLVLVSLPWHGRTPGQPSFSVALQPPDHPEGAAPDAGDVLDGLAQLLQEICQDTGRSAVDLVGYSLGSRFCWNLAAEVPDLVHRSVLGGLPATDRLAALLPHLPGRHGPPASHRQEPDSATAEVLELVHRSSLPEQDMVACAQALANPPFRPEPHSAVPTLLVRGTQDVVADGVQELAGLLQPAAEVLELPGRTHVDALTSGTFVRAVGQFLTAGSPPLRS